MALALVFGIIIAFVHFFNEKIEITDKVWHSRAISFVAGISVTYAFLSLLPEAYESFERFDRLIFIFIVGGFTAVHVTEKFFYQNIHKKSELLLSLKEVHSASFFLYYLLLGAILVDLSQSGGTIQSTLFFIPLLFYASIGVVSMAKIHRNVTSSITIKALLSTSTIIGVFISGFLLQSGAVFDIMFAFVIGAFIYITLIDFIPRERNGDPLAFALGVGIYSILIATLLL